MQPTSAVQQLLARSAKLRLFVMLRRTLRPEALAETLEAHLRWMIEQEAQARIFLSGPTTPRDGSIALDGLTIIRADSLDAAEQIAAEDPFVRSGIVSFEMREWIVNEGSIPLTVTLSNSTVTF